MADTSTFTARDARRMTDAVSIDLSQAYDQVIANIQGAAKAGGSQTLTTFPAAQISRVQAESLVEQLRSAGFNAAVTVYNPQSAVIQAGW